MPPPAPWPAWKKIAAYAILSALAVAAVWFIDRKVPRGSNVPASPPPLQEKQ